MIVGAREFYIPLKTAVFTLCQIVYIPITVGIGTASADIYIYPWITVDTVCKNINAETFNCNICGYISACIAVFGRNARAAEYGDRNRVSRAVCDIYVYIRKIYICNINICIFIVTCL